MRKGAAQARIKEARFISRIMQEIAAYGSFDLSDPIITEDCARIMGWGEDKDRLTHMRHHLDKLVRRKILRKTHNGQIVYHLHRDYNGKL